MDSKKNALKSEMFRVCLKSKNKMCDLKKKKGGKVIAALSSIINN